MKLTTKKICLTAVFMALVVVLSSFGVPVAGGQVYLNGIIITFAALFLDPICAFFVGGVGAFLGDFFFYPAPMFVSLVVHGVQAVAISLISGGYKGELPKLWRACLAVAVGAVISVCGYTFGKFFYAGDAWWARATAKLPYQILQDFSCSAIGVVLMYATPLKKYAYKAIKKQVND